MIITNRNKLPELIYRFLEQDFYDHEAVSGTISATTLLKPVQEIILTERYSDRIEIDAIDRIWTIFGSAVHEVLSRIEGEDIEQEKRLYTDIEGIRVSGKFDIVNMNRIYDYKVTSAWTIVYGSRNEDWKKQLSLYRWIYWKERNVLLDDTGYIIAILRDWSRSNIGGRYPELPIIQLEYKLELVDVIENFVKRKIDEIMRAREMDDTELPRCTDRERWWNDKTGRYMRCEKYCMVKDFCQQIKKEMQ